MPRSEGRDDPSSAPPSITIEALFDYVGEGEYELSFSHGECFMVADASDEEWYEVCYGRNFGMVPKSYFAVVDDGAKTSASSKMSAASTRDGPMRSKASTAEDRVRTHMSKDLPHIPTSSSDPKTTTSTIKLAALYDFEAESVDELTVRAGEQLVLVAQDTSSEWYYARNPRWHGGDDVPEYGLVPVAFMEPKPQRDSNVLPTFANWQAIQREQADPSTAAVAVAVAPHTETFQQTKQQQHERDHEHAREHTHDHEPPLLHSLLSLALPSLTTMLERTNDETLDVTPVHVYHVTVERHGGVQHVLHRTYDQFFALQKEMLRLFPKEAGQLDGKWVESVSECAQSSDYARTRTHAHTRIQRTHTIQQPPNAFCHTCRDLCRLPQNKSLSADAPTLTPIYAISCAFPLT